MGNLRLHFISFPPLAFRIVRGLSVSYLRLRGHLVLVFPTSFHYLLGVVVLYFEGRPGLTGFGHPGAMMYEWSLTQKDDGLRPKRNDYGG